MRSKQDRAARAVHTYLSSAAALTASVDASLQVEHLNFTYPGLFYPLIVDASCRLQLGGEAPSRVGLVGPNGQGKTTLIRLLLGELTPDSGVIARPTAGLKVAYLPQTLVEERAAQPLGDFVQEPLAEVFAMRDGLSALEQRMAQGDYAPEVLSAYGDLQEAFAACDGYTAQQRLRATLQHLGLDAPDLFSRPLAQLSVGQRVRAALARLLLTPAALLVLDEPTNHLDADAIAWLEGYLSALHDQALLIVSHDRAFLDKVIDETWLIERGQLQTYNGNYTAAEQQRRAEHARMVHAYSQQQREIHRLEDSLRARLDWSQRREQDKLRGPKQHTDGTIDRGFIGACAARQAARAIATRSRIEHELASRRADLPQLSRSAALSFHCPGAVPTRLLTTRDLSVGYDGQRALLQHLNLDVTPRARFALVGPNGCGKSTLLNTLRGALPPSAGSLYTHPHLRVAYLSQTPDDLRQLDPELPAISAVSPRGALDGWARTLLGALGLVKDDALRPLGALSPGQRARVALAKIMFEGAHLLLLDEPTNHLDLPTIEALERALHPARFSGAVIVASHDRRFVQRLNAQRIDFEALDVSNLSSAARR
jgi:ATP-binding cassette, subfamily F, member 3